MDDRILRSTTILMVFGLALLASIPSVCSWCERWFQTPSAIAEPKLVAVESQTSPSTIPAIHGEPTESVRPVGFEQELSPLENQTDLSRSNEQLNGWKQALMQLGATSVVVEQRSESPPVYACRVLAVAGGEGLEKVFTAEASSPALAMQKTFESLQRWRGNAGVQPLP